LINLIRQDGMRFDIRSGYDFESMRINLGPKLELDRIDQSVAFQWQSNRWRGKAIAHLGFDRNEPTDKPVDWGASLEANLRVLSFKSLDLGLNFKSFAERDGIREQVGLEPVLVGQTVLMSLSYVAGGRVAP
jgi:hypothetical protein